jgi:hypothetical protein
MSMSRSGYSDDAEDLQLWRGAVRSAIRGKRGQAFLKDLLMALDALPVKRLIPEELVTRDGEVCALGSVGVMRGVDLSKVNPEDHHILAKMFNIAPALVQEIEFENDEDFNWNHQTTPEARFERMRAWVERQITTQDREGEHE